jgi:Uma2 family endonuclease
MGGGTPQHAALAVAVRAALLAQTRGGPCRVHSSGLRVPALATGLTTYPDVTVVCGPYESDPQDKNTIVNPGLLVEITSESTEEYGRGEKLESYRRIPALDASIERIQAASRGFVTRSTSTPRTCSNWIICPVLFL